MTVMKKAAAELIGTFWLVFGGCGSALLACGVEHGIGYAGVSLAFGLTVMTMAFAIGHISGCHLNPAVTIGLLVGGRCDKKDVVPYIIAQVLGGIIAAGVLYMIVQPDTSHVVAGTFATNGWSTDNAARFGGGVYGMGAAFTIEAVLTMIFLFVIMGATDKRAPAGFGPIAIGLCLTLIHLISIPVTNTSVNPARSTAMAIFTGGEPLMQLWLFWVAPIIGGVVGALIYKLVACDCSCVEAKVESAAASQEKK